MANSPPWLVASTLALLGVALVTRDSSETPKKAGSPNAAMVPRLVGQVVGFLGNAGFDASSLGGDQIGLGAADGPGAARAQGIADRVLLSTGYRASLGQQDDRPVLRIVRGPNVPPSIDRPMAQG